MKPIGGFFELELPAVKHTCHPNALALSTGRACLRVMLQNLIITKCYVPFYTCDALFDPFRIEQVEIETYGLNEQMEPEQLPELKANEYFLYINYFGVKSKTIGRLLEKYGSNLLVDNTHLFFHKGYESNWSFTSARKYFGVPDGAYLYNPLGSKLEDEHDRFTGASLSHNVSRLLGLQSRAHKEYDAYERSLTSDVHLISVVSERLLSLVDYAHVQKVRLQNFHFIHHSLGTSNQLKIDMPETDVPFAYPYLPEKLLDKTKFYQHSFFIPSLWLDPFKRSEPGYERDKELALKLFPIPIDHRYDEQDLQKIINLIKSYV